MLEPRLLDALRGYLDKIRTPIDLVASLDDSALADEMDRLLAQIAGLSSMIGYRKDGTAERRPSFEIRRVGEDVAVSFAGLPMGHEFNSLVLALLQVGGHPPKIEPELAEQVRGLGGRLHFETFFSQSCQSCPDVVQALNAMAALNPAVRHVGIDGAAFPEEAEARGVMAVPTVFLNGAFFASGRMTLEEILAKLDTGSTERLAGQLEAKAPYDVLIVGGGPAGASAAIYAARKGIRTGLVAERFGGQVLDTAGIENFISVPHTEGPQLAAALEAHVRAHEVDIITAQRARALLPAGRSDDGLHRVELENGARLRARSVILATGARWRQLNVPGEDRYRTRGVAYCPHCDGPLFRGKRVAVIGGGNSGVEAAIDLAGIVAHVTLIEFDARLRADEVLQRRLRSLPNVKVLVQAQTTEILGDGSKVTGLRWRDRASGEEQHIELDGVFVQIGLLPSTEWLEGTVERNRHGEIVVDARGQTSVPGVFAAGDATTVPYKQIVIAMGEGSKAALSAFDHLIRTPLPETREAEAA
ncbi:MAG: alkyl hydroperoxide reductase subunit F [Lysobacteraceae bacterium]|nr:MAG: alkyl hydroperoxide reductase subunit F [Xanthomonadaceae bacterium]